MATVVIMPRQGQSVESCIFTEWFKQVGDEIKKGEPLFAYETDKASFEDEAPEDGILLGVFCEEGDEVPVLQNIAVIGKAGESIDAFKPGASAESKGEPEQEKSLPETVAETTPEVLVETKTKSAGEEVKISPRAKKLALEKGVPFETLVGSGPEGRVIERDVQAYIASNPKMTPLAKEVAKQEEVRMVEQGSGLAGTVKAADLTAKNPVYAGDFEIKKMPHIRKLIAKAIGRAHV